MTNIYNFIDFFSLNLNTNSQLNVIITDIFKAFNKLNHKKLVHMMNTIGVYSKLMKLFFPYFSMDLKMIRFMVKVLQTKG